MVRLLAHRDKAAESVVRAHLAAAARRLRQKLGWLAIPKADTREELSRSLGRALIQVAIGDFSSLTEGETLAPAAGGVLWQDRLLGFVRWFAIAGGPALVVWSAWRLIDDATKGIALQFAALCFVVATFSALDPEGRDKLSSVVSAGASLFGWGARRA